MKSDFLFAQPSWISGAGRAIDLWGIFEEFNDSQTEEIADERGLYSDWRKVADDLFGALERERSNMLQAELSPEIKEKLMALLEAGE